MLTIAIIITSCGSGTCNNPNIVIQLDNNSGGISNGESNTTLNPKIVLSFSVPMNPSTLNNQSILLSTSPLANNKLNSESSTIIPIGHISESNNNQIFTFEAANPPLAQNTKFYITITAEVKSSNGQAINTTQFSFTTGTFAAPIASIIYPTDGESNIAVNPTIQISFNESVQNINANNIKLHALTPDGAITLITNITAMDNNTYQFTPALNLNYNTSYYLVLESAIVGINGNPIVQTTSSFNTLQQTTPSVDIIYPTAGESNIVVNPTIQISFSEAVQNVTANNIKLHSVTQNGDVTLVNNITLLTNNTYQFTPAINLNYNTSYYLVLESGITGSSNNPIVTTTSSFSTLQQTVNKTWIGGNQTNNQAGVYGTKGTPSINNLPGARSLSASWTDDDGNLWLFGGNGYDGSNFSYINDLWKYNIATKQWSWISGSNIIDQAGVYGTQGTTALSNTPGARNGAMTWKDTQGNFWLFGGYGYGSNNTNIGYLNDLWKFNPVNETWTWVSGSNSINQPSDYGTKGNASVQNQVGARDSSVSWIDKDNNLWLFGGCQSIDSTSCSDINDLWKYNTSSNQWTWVSGNNTVNQGGEYGTKGTPSVNNLPTPRDTSTGWVDLKGNLWLFGGYNYPNGLNFNDLWRYNPTTNEWTWMTGSSIAEQPGTYGTKLIESVSNTPGAREDSASWVDSSGNFWLFGGSGYDKNNNWGKLNDFWKYNPLTNAWTWMSGNGVVNMQTLYGSQGVTSVNNSIGGREDPAIWTDNNGNIWLFGGNGYGVVPWPNQGLLSDLWLINLQ